MKVLQRNTALSHTCTNQLFRTKYLLRHRSEIRSDDNNDKELNNVLEIQTGCGNFSKMETSTESLCCCEMLEISDE